MRKLWIWVAVIFEIDIIWTAAAGVSIDTRGILARITELTPFFAMLGILHLLRITRTRRGAIPLKFSANAEIALHSILYWSVATGVLGVLQYLIISINAPLVESNFAAIDRLVGFDWMAFYKWTAGHPWIHLLLVGAYQSAGIQAALISIYFCLRLNASRLFEFYSCSLLTIVLVLAISAPFPAHTATIFYGVADAADMAAQFDFNALRSGALRVFNINAMQGLICMPSLHAALALLFSYSMRRTRLFSSVAAINATMAVSTLTIGGHYLLDTLAGISTATVAIGIIKVTSRSHVPVGVVARVDDSLSESERDIPTKVAAA